MADDSRKMSDSFVQLHTKTKPIQKRSLEDIEDFDSHKTYMVVKKLKRESQFDAMKTEGKSTKSYIFQGVTIYVNGWTQPKASELKELVYEHGGKYDYNLYGRSSVTHTIASNLPNSKILKIGNSVVCKPEWIVDSIAANKKLPVVDYLLYNNQDGQNKLMVSKTDQDGVPTHDRDMQCGDKSNNSASDVAGGSGPAAAGGNFAGESSRSKKSDFVKDFFSHSRLHYLSTWSTELKQFLADGLRNTSPNISKLEPSQSLRLLNSRAVVHIDLDCFFVSVSLRKNPHLRGKPVAVTHARRNPAKTSSGKLGGESLMGEVVEEDLFLDSSDINLYQDGRNQDGRNQNGRNQDGRNQDGNRSYRSLQDSTSDIASCSYEARKFGISNGMSVGEAVKKCPELNLLPYDFDAYKEVSRAFYSILLQYSSVIEAVSCDEAYLELTDFCQTLEEVMELVGQLRREIETSTGCTVSAGVSHNMFLARMSTRVAKPDGQFLLAGQQVESFLCNQSVRNLPGVGRSTMAKFQDMGISSCGELLIVSLRDLQAAFGTKLGKTLHDYARGVDDRELKTSTDRKSVSVDINFGIRFKEISEAETLIDNLAEELERRSEEANVCGMQITLKMKIRKPTAPRESRKFMGHGACDNVSKSMALLQPVREASECSRLALKLLKQIKPVAEDIRGVGLQLSKLVDHRAEAGAQNNKDEKGGAQGQQLLKFFKAEPELSSEPKNNRESSNECPPSAHHHKQLKKVFVEPPPRKAQSPKDTKFRRRRGRGRGGGRRGTSTVLSERSPLKKSPVKSPPVKSPSKSLRHYFKSAVDTKETLSVATTADSDQAGTSSIVPANKVVRNLDETFSLDLPPASQLDSNVLKALPTQLREKILASYGSMGQVSGQHAPTTNGRPDVNPGPVEAEEKPVGIGKSKEANNMAFGEETGEEQFEVVVRDEDRLLEDWKADIDEWTCSFRDGPSDDDVLTVATHFCKMTCTNLKMVEVCLKVFRRFLLTRALSAWSTCYNVLLEQVQEKVLLVYGGTLKVEPLELRNSPSEGPCIL